MSSFDDILEILQRINNIYNPILQSVNADTLIVASSELANISALQAPYPMQELLVNFSRSVRNSMNIDYFNIADLSKSMQTIVKSVQPNIELVNANMFLFMQNYADMVSDLNSIGYNISELV